MSHQKCFDLPYLEWLKEWAADNSDGCTGVLDIYVECCYQHDFEYETGVDALSYYKAYVLNDGEVTYISRGDADKQFNRCLRCQSFLHNMSPIGWWRWIGVRLLGWWAWIKHRRHNAPFS